MKKIVGYYEILEKLEDRGKGFVNASALAASSTSPFAE
jgi:hypothetical protein